MFSSRGGKSNKNVACSSGMPEFLTIQTLESVANRDMAACTVQMGSLTALAWEFPALLKESGAGVK